MTVKQDLKALQREFKALGKKVEKLTKAVEKAEKTQVQAAKAKTVTTVSAFQLADDELKNLATELKRRCGTSGSVKEGVIIIQGDHRDTLITELKNRGFNAKIAGG